jgi:hypothetical protein
MTVEHTVKVTADDPRQPMTLAEVEEFTAQARQAGACDTAPVTFQTTVWARRSRALSTAITAPARTATGAGHVNLEVKAP